MSNTRNTLENIGDTRTLIEKLADLSIKDLKELALEIDADKEINRDLDGFFFRVFQSLNFRMDPMDFEKFIKAL